MTWNPWLTKYYKQIIQHYNTHKLHHSIIIESCNIKDTFKLIWAISKWILCIKKKKMKNCGICKGCKLTLTHNNPDFYVLYPKKNKKFIDIETIRNTINNIVQTSQQYGNKILWIPKYQTLTNFGINALLKIIEEPPKNTWFFIGNDKFYKLNITFRSRCLLYQILQPIEDIGLNWIQKNIIIPKKICLTSLRINNYSPELAIDFLQSSSYKLRDNLCMKLYYAIDNNNFSKLLPIINDHQAILKIQWIILLLLDAMKIKKKLSLLLDNLDQIHLIKKISTQYSYYNLHKIIKYWIKCKYQLINIENINYELLILNQLLKWEKFFIFN
ncbi:DNA polymerase III subunit delta' [Buchnera aphidicola (Phyllaphis fagi)]